MRRLQILLTTCAVLSLMRAVSGTCAVAVEPYDRLAEPPSASAADLSERHVWHFRWAWNLQSADGRPIETVEIGRGSFRTLVVGSVHGSEPMAIAVVEELARHLGNQPDHWHEFHSLIVKTPNPDGLVQGSSLNSHGVDLNHNFPTSDFPAEPSSRSGPEAGSEIETRAVRYLLETYRPHRVVHVKSTRNAIGWALCNRQARAAASFLTELEKLRVGRLEDHLVAGSLESYTSRELAIETITLAVPHEPDQTAVWRDYRNALLAASAFVDPAWRPNTRYARTHTALPARTPRNLQRRASRRETVDGIAQPFASQLRNRKRLRFPWSR